MKRGLLVCSKHNEKEYREIISLLMNCVIWKDYSFERLQIEEKSVGGIGLDRILSTNTDVIISMDMAGFQYKTLLENYLYNIIPGKQLHIVLDIDKWHEYSGMDFAINLFLYLPQGINEDIEVDKENPNIRYYSSKLLGTKKDMLSKIIDDFVKASGL